MKRQAPVGWAALVFICVLFTALSPDLRRDLAQSGNSLLHLLWGGRSLHSVKLNRLSTLQAIEKISELSETSGIRL